MVFALISKSVPITRKRKNVKQLNPNTVWHNFIYICMYTRCTVRPIKSSLIKRYSWYTCLVIIQKLFMFYYDTMNDQFNSFQKPLSCINFYIYKLCEKFYVFTFPYYLTFNTYWILISIKLYLSVFLWRNYRKLKSFC